MPKDEIDYSNTIIYKITCKNKAIQHVYVGHTTNFVQRKHSHKQSCISNKSPNHNCKLYEVIRENGGWDNWHMEIINFFNCSGQYEAREKEQEYFVALNATLNSIEPLSKNKTVTKNKNIVRPIEKPVFFCNTCHINCINSISFDKHIKTKKHQKNIKNGTENIVISNYKFSCEKCHFECYKKPDYGRHLLTTKHKNMVNNLNKTANKIENKCKKCSKVYKSRNGLWLHSKKCVKKESPPIENPEDDIKQIKNIILDLVKSNTELQKQMLEVCKGSIKS